MAPGIVQKHRVIGRGLVHRQQADGKIKTVSSCLGKILMVVGKKIPHKIELIRLQIIPIVSPKTQRWNASKVKKGVAEKYAAL